MKIRILVFEGVDEIDVIGPYEVLKRAAVHQTSVDVALATLDGSSRTTGAHDLCIDHPNSNLQAADLLIVPGGGWNARAPVGIRREIEKGELPRRIAEFHQKGALIAGVCTGVMALAAAGILDGRSATTHHTALPDLAKTQAKVVHARVVDDGDIITCGGVTSSFDLALWLVERLWGTELSDRLTAELEYPRSTDIFVTPDFVTQDLPQS